GPFRNGHTAAIRCPLNRGKPKVHHVQDWAHTHTTDIDQLTLACGPHHRLLDKGWITRKRASGDTEWIPPAHLDRGQPRTNTFHHPEKLLGGEEDDGP
ncbi:HNH endonuclease signature motif containing protein, partial [Mycobacterium colombiense]|uniref:HNH endonuclease signature motif containing protein n=1 Tax=Mycobacterium colombiense TaxID=339268 RepID=UPI000A535E3A